MRLVRQVGDRLCGGEGTKYRLGGVVVGGLGLGELCASSQGRAPGQYGAQGRARARQTGSCCAAGQQARRQGPRGGAGGWLAQEGMCIRGPVCVVNPPIYLLLATAVTPTGIPQPTHPYGAHPAGSGQRRLLAAYGHPQTSCTLPFTHFPPNTRPRRASRHSCATRCTATTSACGSSTTGGATTSSQSHWRCVRVCVFGVLGERGGGCQDDLWTGGGKRPEQPHGLKVAVWVRWVD